MSDDDAIFNAAVDALERRARAYMLNRTEVLFVAEDVLAAARPLIEADLRERLAAAIEARAAESEGMFAALPDAVRAATFEVAARIVRERP